MGSSAFRSSFVRTIHEITRNLTKNVSELSCCFVDRFYRLPTTSPEPQWTKANWPLTFIYLIPTTMESGPTSCSTRVELKPASRIHSAQSSPV